jgi:hypothetical protein
MINKNRMHSDALYDTPFLESSQISHITTGKMEKPAHLFINPSGRKYPLKWNGMIAGANANPIRDTSAATSIKISKNAGSVTLRKNRINSHPFMLLYCILANVHIIFPGGKSRKQNAGKISFARMLNCDACSYKFINLHKTCQNQ